jgi:hypothetical protein
MANMQRNKKKTKKTTRPGHLPADRVILEERIRAGIFVKRKPAEAIEAEALARACRQRQGFHEGAAVPGSNLRKVEK